MSNIKFNSIKELADTLNISRTTLYKRSKEYNIDLNGTYTQNEIDTLKEPIKHSNGVQSDEQGNERYSEQNEHINEQNEHLNSVLINQLKIKDDQISQAYQTISDTNKLLDQAQQLQLDLQHKLQTTEQERLDLLDKNKRLMTETSTASELEEEVNSLSSELEDAQSKSEKLQQRYATQRQLLHSYLSENKELQTQKNELLDQASTFNQVQSEAEQLKAENKRLSEFLEQINNDRGSLTTQVSTLEQQLNQEKSKGFWKRLFNR